MRRCAKWRPRRSSIRSTRPTVASPKAAWPDAGAARPARARLVQSPTPPGRTSNAAPSRPAARGGVSIAAHGARTAIWIYGRRRRAPDLDALGSSSPISPRRSRFDGWPTRAVPTSRSPGSRSIKRCASWPCGKCSRASAWSLRRTTAIDPFKLPVPATYLVERDSKQTRTTTPRGAGRGARAATRTRRRLTLAVPTAEALGRAAGRRRPCRVVRGAIEKSLASRTRFANGAPGGLSAPWDLAARCASASAACCCCRASSGTVSAKVAPRQGAALGLYQQHRVCGVLGSPPASRSPAAQRPGVLHGMLPLTTYLSARARPRLPGATPARGDSARCCGDRRRQARSAGTRGRGSATDAAARVVQLVRLQGVTRRLALRPEHTASIVAVLPMAAALAEIISWPGLRFYGRMLLKRASKAC